MKLPPYKTVRCRFYNDSGRAKDGYGCPRSAAVCNFIHPSDDEWTPPLKHSAQSRCSPSPPPRPYNIERGRTGRSRERSPGRPPQRERSPDYVRSPLKSSSTSLLSRIERFPDATSKNANSLPRAHQFSVSSTALSEPVPPPTSSAASEPPPMPSVPPDTPTVAPMPSMTSAVSDAAPTPRLSIPFAHPATPTAGSAAKLSASSAVRKAFPQSTPAPPQAPPKLAPSAPRTTLLPPPPLPPTPPPPSVPATSDKQERGSRRIKNFVEAVRVRKELEELDEELQQHRSLASGISRFKDQDKAQDIVSSRVEMLEKQYKEKQSRYETLVAELAPNSWWPQPFDAEAQKAHLAAVTKRFSKIHAELAPLGLIPPPPTTDGMEVGDDVMRHDEGSKHPLPETSSGSEASISRGKDYASLRRTLDGLADRINDVEDTHAEKMKILEERTQMIADELRKPEFERNEDVVNYELLLKRVAASEAQARQLSTVAAELQAQTAAAVVNLQAARAENDELKNMLEELETQVPAVASGVRAAQQELSPLQHAIALQLIATSHAQMPQKQLLQIIEEPLQREIFKAVEAMLAGHTTECDEVLDRHVKEWTEGVVATVHKTLGVVQGLAGWSDRNQTSSTGPAAH